MLHNQSPKYEHNVDITLFQFQDQLTMSLDSGLQIATFPPIFTFAYRVCVFVYRISIKKSVMAGQSEINKNSNVKRY